MAAISADRRRVRAAPSRLVPLPGLKESLRAGGEQFPQIRNHQMGASRLRPWLRHGAHLRRGRDGGFACGNVLPDTTVTAMLIPTFSRRHFDAPKL
jgi:hypothetical protein